MTEPHDHLDPPTYFSVCSGIGGLDLALERVTGARAVGYCERESYAQAVLMARMEDEALGAAPLWDDLRQVPGARLRGLVDWLIGGIPCQPHSSAGRQRRGDDDRDLIDAFCELAGEMEPRYILVENVRGFVAGDGLGRLLGRLAEIGFDAEWISVRASDVGAPHRRERVFVLAYRSGEGLQGLKQNRGSQQDEQRTRRSGRAEVADANGWGFRADSGAELHDRLGSPLRDHLDQRDGRLGWPPGPGGDWRGIPEWCWPALGDTAGDGQSGRRGSPERGHQHAVMPRQGPKSDGARPEEVEPRLRGMADGLPELVELAMRYRTDRLRCLGNAVVPQQAELALRILLQRLNPCNA